MGGVAEDVLFWLFCEMGLRKREALLLPLGLGLAAACLGLLLLLLLPLMVLLLLLVLLCLEGRGRVCLDTKGGATGEKAGRFQGSLSVLDEFGFQRWGSATTTK